MKFARILTCSALFYALTSCNATMPPVIAKNEALQLGAGFVFVCQEEPSILLAKRSKHSSEPGTWAGLGGAVELGETPIEAARREVIEEAGSMPKFDRILATLRHERDGLVFITFIANLSKSEKDSWHPKKNFEHDAITWFRELPDNIHPGLESALKTIGKQ